MSFTKDDIHFASLSDVNDWLELVSLTIDGFPCMDESNYFQALHRSIEENQALILRDEEMAIGVMVFSFETGSIDFLAVHPQYRKLGIAKLFLDKLMSETIIGKEISITTYRAGDKADTGYREELYQLGFSEKELLIEFGYPTQRFVLSQKQKKEIEQ